MSSKALLLVLAVIASGCVCLTQFDPESQHCETNAPAGQQCLAGYECRTDGADGGLCKRVDAGMP